MAGFRWTPEADERLTALYLAGLPGVEIAARIGNGCTTVKVRKRAHRLGLAARRSPQAAAMARVAALREASLKGAAVNRERAAARRGRTGRFTFDELAGLRAADDAALIEAAIAAGRVTRVPAGTAAGLTAVERSFWASPANPGGSWKAQQQARKKARYG